MIKQGNEENFNDLKSNGVVLVDFYANWCGPCKMLGPVLEEIANERGSVDILKVDVDENPLLAKNYGIMSIPTMLLFKNGQLISTKNGFMSKDEIENWLNDIKWTYI